MWIERVFVGYDGVLAYEMRQDVKPLLVPCQDSGPELIRLVWFQLALERAADGAEGESEERLF